MSSPPPSKRPKSSPATNEAEATSVEVPPAETSATAPPVGEAAILAPTHPKGTKRPRSPGLDTRPPPLPLSTTAQASGAASIPPASRDEGAKKRGRTNTPWTAQEEQRLKQMRDAGNSWGEIAKAFPLRTEGSVKKHWYKVKRLHHRRVTANGKQDMHYAEFGDDDSAALLEAIREYDANKWKFIGAKIGKPAKACEQYAKEHFKNM